MDDNLVGNLIKELQKLGVSQYSAHLSDKLTRFTEFASWEARCKAYLQSDNAKVQSGAILAPLDEKIHDRARSADISVASTPSVLQSDFQRRFQHPGDSVNDFQQALQILGRKALHTMDATALNTRVLEHFFDGVRDPHFRMALLRTGCQPFDKAFALVHEEKVLQADCEQPQRSLFSVTAI
ncbi:unnamed protein product [Schistocephalus solidus]|uniref:Uncharacterized protein n=1 Tax=Schistocephalus solidus TaxID=70667 RepID=A0A183TJQ0_SCHSO|nr:unnamed protein product [Schistocephalus solidus]